MGGEYEKTLTQKAETPVGSTTGKPMTVGSVRVHNNPTEGKVHFHDDGRKLKVAVPTADYFTRYNAWKVAPEQPLRFVDADHKTELVLVARRVLKNPPELDVDIQISALDVGGNFKLLEDFVNAR